MCKYCSRLKELRQQDAFLYERDKRTLNCSINAWKRRCANLEGIIHWMILELEEPSDDVLRGVLIKKAKELLAVNYVGK